MEDRSFISHVLRLPFWLVGTTLYYAWQAVAFIVHGAVQFVGTTLAHGLGWLILIALVGGGLQLIRG